MELRVTIPMFLKRKLLEHKLSLKALSIQSGLHYQTIKNMHLGLKSNPDINTLIKIADFFQCSIDEVIGRDTKCFPNNQYITLLIKKLNPNQASLNLKKFILQRTTSSNTNLNRLSINIGFSSGLLSDFVREERPMKSLSALSIYKIANYFDISIDEMIGRISYDYDNFTQDTTDCT